MRFDVVRGGRETARVPKRLRGEYLLPSPSTVRTFPLGFQADPPPGQWLIDGKIFDHDRIDVQPTLGTTETWRFVNDTVSMHPMHAHLAHFKVISVNGRRPHPAERGMKDTVAVWPNQTAVVRPYFTHHTGRFVYHCHALEHGDHEMMAQMQVVA
jgi:FtsP/CotA-like multicopper oxidase with cupredoxin domain